MTFKSIGWNESNVDSSDINWRAQVGTKIVVTRWKKARVERCLDLEPAGARRGRFVQMKSRGRLSIRINLRNFYRRKGEALIQPACHLKRRKIHWGNQLFPCIFVPRPTGIVITGDKSLRGHRLGQGINETDMIRWPWRVSLISDVPLGRVHGGTFESTMCLAPRHVIRPHKDWNRVMPGNSLPRSPTHSCPNDTANCFYQWSR